MEDIKNISQSALRSLVEKYKSLDNQQRRYVLVGASSLALLVTCVVCRYSLFSSSHGDDGECSQRYNAEDDKDDASIPRDDPTFVATPMRVNKAKPLSPPTPPNSPLRFIRKSCTVSAPSKALVAGGYLVLKRPNLGIVISTTARFYSTIKLLPIDKNREKDELGIVVESPQFHSTTQFCYNTSFNKVTVESMEGNVFVEKCIWIVMSFAKKHLGDDVFNGVIGEIVGNNVVGIKLRADNDFYSQIKKLKSEKLPLVSKSLRTLPKFYECPIKDDGSVEVAKTGMGSSAALTVSLVGALLQWFGIVKIGERDGDEDKVRNDCTLIHNLSQIAHAVAQGKCGSGFDVSAAVFGTQMYIRFDPEPLIPCMESTATAELIHNAAKDNQIWNQATSPFSLPPGMDIIMGDVCGGSPSSSMAKAVLNWLKEKEVQSKSVWTALSEANKSIYDTFVKLNTIAAEHPEQFMKDIGRAADITADKWSQEVDLNGVFSLLQNTRKLFKRTRFWLKRMGDNAGVGIEPDSQTALADRTESLGGVLCSGVPGAGGNDAIFAIVLSTTGRENVERVWSSWETSMRGKQHGTVVCPLTVATETDRDRVGVLVEPSIDY